MRILFCIQGEGRGHLTQAMATREILEAAGHEIAGVIVGMGRRRQLPPFFLSAMPAPPTVMPTPEFAFRGDRAIALPATLAGVIRHAPAYARSLRQLAASVRTLEPDVILNFFEPLVGIYALLVRRRPPIVAVGHQFMLVHPAYVRASGLRLQQFGLRCFVRLVGANSARLALSLYEAPNLPRRSLVVCPPLLRRGLFDLLPNPMGEFLLVYLLNHGYSEQLIEWHAANPATVIHCFYDKPGAPAEWRYDASLTFHRLDGDKFLRMMAECRLVVCTAGFESLAEAAYLGKPLFVVPLENHIEQEINALDAVRAGLGVSDRRFNLDRLRELPRALDNRAYRAWLGRAGSILLDTLERAAHPSDGVQQGSRERAPITAGRSRYR